MANYSFPTDKKLPVIKDGHTFTNCNFMQEKPNTEIFKGISNLTFKSCNLVNCKLPADAKIISSNTAQKSFCSHLNPKWDLPKCEINCQHVIDTDVIKIDNVTIDTIYHYEDKVIS